MNFFPLENPSSSSQNRPGQYAFDTTADCSSRRWGLVMNHSQMFVRGKSNWHGEAGISSKVWRIPYLADAAHLPTKHPCLRRRHRSTASDTAEAYARRLRTKSWGKTTNVAATHWFGTTR